MVIKKKLKQGICWTHKKNDKRKATIIMNSYNIVDTMGPEYFFLQQLSREIHRINAQSSWRRLDPAAMQAIIAMNGLPKHSAYHFNMNRYNPLQGPIIEKLSEKVQYKGMPQDEKDSTKGLKLLQAANASLPKMPAVTEPVEHLSSERNGDNRVYIDSVEDLDVLCGRGGRSNHHVGNKRFRQVVDEMKHMYRSAGVKAVKTDLSRAIVDHVCLYGGRFVKKDGKSGKYYLLTRVEARKKTSQALRENKELKWKL